MSGTKDNQAAGAKAPVATAAKDTEAGIVAPGRSVMVGRTRHGPGTTVHLPAEEIANLRALGFLLDPEKPLPEASQGPEYHRSRSDFVRAR